MKIWMLMILILVSVGFKATAQMLPNNGLSKVSITGFPESVESKKGAFFLGISPTNKTNGNSVEINDCWICYVDFGNVLVGQSNATSGHYLHSTDPDVSISFGSYTISGVDYSVTVDNCSGNTVRNSQCSIDFAFTPTTPGFQKSATVTWPATVCVTTEDGTECDNRTVYIFLSGSSLEIPPAEPCFECGSLINVDERSIVETVPITGTDIKIVYSSAMTPQFISPYNTLGFKNLFNPHGLTLSTQHFLDYPQRRLYRGSGEVEDVKLPAGAGDHLVVSKRGDEVYVFESSGRHKETRYGLTGATKYTFNYTTGNRLSSIVDAFGNTTTFTRDGSGNLTEIVAPFGQVNLITLNSDGLIHKVENPAGEIYELTYKSGTKLVETFERPGGQISTYTYDSNGRLIKDEGHGGNFWSLIQNTGLPGQPITLASKMGDKRLFKHTSPQLSPISVLRPILMAMW